MHYKKLTHHLSPTLKKIIGCDSGDPLTVGGYPLIVRNFWISQHNLDHIEVARLDRIQIGTAQVSGIHGFYSSMYHNEPIDTEYDGILDEVRVFIHEAVTRTSIASIAKLCYWMGWMITQKINPIAVVFRHIVSIRSFQKKLRHSQEREMLLQVGPVLHLEFSPRPGAVILSNEIAGLTEAQVLALRHPSSSPEGSLSIGSIPMPSIPRPKTPDRPPHPATHPKS